MFFELDANNPTFPDPELSEPDGLLAIGGDLSPKWLIEAYSRGIFPWFDKGQPILWWSLNPRMVLYPQEFKYSKSLRRVVESGKYQVRVDTCFEAVMRNCAQVHRQGQDGTWISDRMIQAYVELYELGYAHSFEVFYHGALVGGLYGISVGNIFCGESMFHTMTDASKVAFVKLVEFCALHGFRLIDAQQKTAHLASLGARPIPRTDYLQQLKEMDMLTTLRTRWTRNTAVILIGGNQGDRLQLLNEATEQVGEQIGRVSLVSPVYETEPWGYETDAYFLNQALVVDTKLEADEVLFLALSIEARLGRKRSQAADKSPDNPSNPHNYSDRPIDIDLIFFNSRIIDTPQLQLPHPRMHLRRFVLMPICDIIPNFVHPVLKKTMRQLLDICPDDGRCKDI